MNEIEELTLELIGENISDPDVFLNTDEGLEPVRDSINSAIQELAALTESFVKTFHLPVLDGRQFYRISPRRDYWGYALEVFDRRQRRKLQRTSLHRLLQEDPWWQKLGGAGTLTHYFQVGIDTLALYKTPSATGNVLEIQALMIPQRYQTSSDVVHLRQNFQRAAAFYAVSEYYASRGDAVRAAAAYKEYLELSTMKLQWPRMPERTNERSASRFDSVDGREEWRVSGRA
jgi:hypothetical protein